MCDRDFSCGKTRFFRDENVALPLAAKSRERGHLCGKNSFNLTLPTRIDRLLLFFASPERWLEPIFTSSARCDQSVDNRK
jgi:hypothetical protein